MWITRLFLMLNSCVASSARVLPREFIRRMLLEEMRRDNVLTSPTAVRDYLRLLFRGREYESFAVLYLDSQNRLIASEEVFRGTLNQTSVYPREIVKRALAQNCAAVIFSHCHPSGVAEPSRADELLTTTLKQQCQAWHYCFYAKDF